ncbi:MAG TPA: S41 family peptidase [Syntrophomonadaceae bacterium]|nr:S41 family peptidase [Syntrophomonadaceae bacterium]
MKENRVLRGFSIFFAIFGAAVFGLLLAAFITNAAGLGTLLSVIGLVKAESLHDIDSKQMIEGAAAGIVEALGDPYSRYLSKEEWQELKVQLNAEFGGIGVYIIQREDGHLVIVSPIKGTPAERAGIKHGDIITRINGESATRMNQDKAVQLMRGEPGTQLELSVLRPADGQEYHFKIIREMINVPSVEDKMLDAEAGIAYIRLTHFSAHSSDEMRKSLEKFDKAGMKGLVLDLRDNGGGDFEAALDISNMFLDGKKEIVKVRDVRGREVVHTSTQGAYKIPVVVLVNGNSASSSEILSGALKDNQRAILVGEKTYGKGLVQTVYPLRGGAALKLTTQKYFTPSGTDINEIGIVPDYVVKNPENGQKDLQLEKAIEVLKQQMQS